MGDPFRKVQPGDDLEIAAVAWNDMIAKTRVMQDIKGPPTPSPALRQAAIIKVKNESGDDLPRNAVLGLADPIFTVQDASEDAFLREVTFRGNTPDITRHKRRFCVTIDPAQAGAIVRAYVAGVCAVVVNIMDHTHEYATIADGETGHLESSRYGFAQILWREGDEGYGYGYGYDTGPQWTICRLGAHCPSVAIGKANGAISARSGTTFGTGFVHLYRNDSGTADGPLENIPVLNASSTLMNGGSNGIDSGAWVSVAWDMDDTAWVAPLECQADAYS